MFFFTLGAHRDFRSLAHSLFLSLFFSLHDSHIALYRTIVPAFIKPTLISDRNNQPNLLRVLVSCVFMCIRECACLLIVISHDTGINVNIRIK